MRQWSGGRLRLRVGKTEYALTSHGRGFGLVLTDGADAERARFVDHRLRGDQLLAQGRTFTFTDDDEHLTDEQGERPASFTPRKGAVRVVLVDVHAPLGLDADDDTLITLFAAVIVLLRRLPARPPKRFGLDSGKAWESRDVWVAGALTGHADGSF